MKSRVEIKLTLTGFKNLAKFLENHEHDIAEEEIDYGKLE